eukprot:gnl/MRDRNA2_/MRDRNA2_67062_c0_seq1.p1 gnl/MRDRNA2_/MRDRNA2_67062_c0~~gnl/MRDRNA2_/MRDRNA2_67062_c0_seq1.p1  ORF type:complete len:222 (-),score=40.77 gnl/MRDRNA2_/MRDRNA2_67062_c0_seq1:67-732(-)
MKRTYEIWVVCFYLLVMQFFVLGDDRVEMELTKSLLNCPLCREKEPCLLECRFGQKRPWKACLEECLAENPMMRDTMLSLATSLGADKHPAPDHQAKHPVPNHQAHERNSKRLAAASSQRRHKKEDEDVHGKREFLDSKTKNDFSKVPEVPASPIAGPYIHASPDDINIPALVVVGLLMSGGVIVALLCCCRSVFPGYADAMLGWIRRKILVNRRNKQNLL